VVSIEVYSSLVFLFNIHGFVAMNNILFYLTDPPAQTTTSNPSPSHGSDPEEVSISQHFYQPAPRAQPDTPQQDQDQIQISDEQPRAMMFGFPSGSDTPGPSLRGASANPFAGFLMADGMGTGMESTASGVDSGMLKVLQQMMDGDGPGGTPSFPGMPPIGMPEQQDPGTPAIVDRYAYLWRIVHAVFALGLGLYIALTTTFTGTKFERELSTLTKAAGEGSAASFFYTFATVEVLLQTSRFFLEKGRVQQGELLRMITDFLPEPWKGYLMLLTGYSRIWATASADAMVCVFVLGVCSWVRAS
jgi:GET complex subunit GET2